MKLSAKLKELAWVTAGGVTVAIAFIGISVIFVLFVSGAGVALPYFGHIVEKWAGRWSLEGVYTAFIAAGCAGFVFGTFAGLRHVNIIRKWFSAAIIGGIPMILGLWLVYACANGVQRPREIKLADCTNSITRIHLKVPKGHFYRLAFTTSPSSTNIFSARFNIFEEAITVTNFSMSSEQTESQCDFLRAQTDYDIEIRFDPTPPSSTAVWLRWLQSYKDRDR